MSRICKNKATSIVKCRYRHGGGGLEMRGRQNQSVMGSLVETMLWWGGGRRISSPG